ncbi:hypothetical protein F4780DRAFT_272738 [Xylariomycetidae sp. FL0641]|nr:hypothetical protein F4780DRAFT_272738 [Xylariomycetidae sp. FL0641]
MLHYLAFASFSRNLSHKRPACTLLPFLTFCSLSVPDARVTHHPSNDCLQSGFAGLSAVVDRVMARSTFSDSLFRLPPATVALVLSAALGLSSGHALPRQTKTVEFHELDVVPYPIPTQAPSSPFDFDLFRRQDQNTVCGYLGGNADLPATCSAGSHCVADSANGVIGCCPNGGVCTVGVYTGCVDASSGPQTEVNPYVYSCSGADLCYQNQFAGGFSQYGCGTATDMGTTVQTSIEGGTTSLDIVATDITPTASPTSLSEPTTLGTVSSTSSTSSHSSSSTRSSTSSSSSSSSSSSTSSTPSTSSTSSSSTSSTSSASSTTSEASTTSPTTSVSPSNSDSAAAAPANDGSNSHDPTGAIVGGVVGGAAGLVAIIAIIAFCMRRRRNNGNGGPNEKLGPDGVGGGPAGGNATTEYNSPMRSHGAAFAPLPSWQDEDPGNNGHSSWPMPAAGVFNSNNNHNDNNNNNGQQEYGFSRGPPMAAGGGGLTPVVEEQSSMDEASSRRRTEIDDFTRAYSRAGIGSGSDDDDIYGDRTPLRARDSATEAALEALAGEGLASSSSSHPHQYPRDQQEHPYYANHRHHQPHDSTTTADSRAETSWFSQSPPGSPSTIDADRRARASSGGGRPLWQQNRQQSRNLMWL